MLFSNEAVLTEAWVCCHVEEAALPHRRDLRKPRDRPRQELSILHHSQAPWPFGDEHPAVRQESKAPRVLEAFDDLHDAERVFRGRNGLRATEQGAQDESRADARRGLRGSGEFHEGTGRIRNSRVRRSPNT